MIMTSTQETADSHFDAPPEPPASRIRQSAFLLLAGAVLLPVASMVHPQAATDAEFDAALAEVLANSAWYPAHVLEFAATALIIAALWLIARTPQVRNVRMLRLAVIATAVGAGVHLIDLFPHTFAATEANDLRNGLATPLVDAHLLLQGIATPVFCLAAAALAFVDARRSARWTWIPASLAIVGGILGAIAGPALAITKNSDYGVFFLGYAGIGVWLLVTAVRRLMAVRGDRQVGLT